MPPIGENCFPFLALLRYNEADPNNIVPLLSSGKTYRVIHGVAAAAVPCSRVVL